MVAMMRMKANGHQQSLSLHVYVETLLVIAFLLPYGIEGVNIRPVITINPASPGSSDGTASLSEDAETGIVLAVVEVTDTDTGVDGETTCSIISDSFGLEKFDEGMYKVQLLSKLDREISATKEVRISCHDNGTPSLSDLVSIMIKVEDVNDNSPNFTSSSYNFTVAENTFGATTFSVHATDRDINQNAEIVYSIPETNEKRVSINSQDGTIEIQDPLDYEIDHEVSFTVRTTDGGIPSLSSEAEVVLTVKDLNDNRPFFPLTTFTFSIHSNATVGGTVGDVTAIDIDSGENAELSYSLPNCGDFDINGDGTITVARKLDMTTKNQHECVVTVSDNPINRSDSLQSTATVVIVVTDDPTNGQPASSVLNKILWLVFSCLWIEMFNRIF